MSVEPWKFFVYTDICIPVGGTINGCIPCLMDFLLPASCYITEPLYIWHVGPYSQASG